MPFRFLKGAFESGLAGHLLAHYVQNPVAFLDDHGKAKLGDVSRELWRRLTEATEESSGAIERQASRPSDNAGDGPATSDDLQDDILRNPNEPF
jgi:hypothetical protein